MILLDRSLSKAEFRRQCPNCNDLMLEIGNRWHCNFCNSSFTEEEIIYTREIIELAKDKHGQVCPDCNHPLATIQNSIGGGSHYWLLRCEKCKSSFHYSNYDDELRRCLVTD